MSSISGLLPAVAALCWLPPLWCYAGYPLLCRGWARRQQQWPSLADVDLPAAVVVCVYHNEARHLPTKLANCQALAYPADKLRLLFVSDASDDGSDELVYANGRAELLRRDRRGGKSAGLNAALAHLQASMPPATVVVFTDANTELHPAAVQRLAEALADPAVASACGELTVTGHGEGGYWRGEQMLKRAEGAWGCLIGANGALHAVRLRDWQPLPDGLLMEDLLIPLRLLMRGRAVYVPSARAQEEGGGSVMEFRRKVRIATANYAMLPLLLRLRLPLRAQCCLWSHKILRWLCAPLLLPLLALTAVLLWRWAGWWWGAPLLLIIPAAVAAGCGLLWGAGLRTMWHGLLMHLAFTVGAMRALTGTMPPHWEHERR